MALTKQKGIPWDELQKHGVLGVIRDAKLAVAFGCNPSTVMRARRHRELPIGKKGWGDVPGAREWVRSLAAMICGGPTEAVPSTLRSSQVTPSLLPNSDEAPTIPRAVRSRVAPSLDEFLKDAAATLDGAWPEAACDELDEIVRRNDEMPPGHRFIPAYLAVDRLRDAWGVEATADDVERYARSKGRGSWTAK